MDSLGNRIVEQSRWDEYGRQAAVAVRRQPSSHVLRACPLPELVQPARVMQRLGCLKGTRVLEIGCGRGALSVYLARRGARVTGVDVSSNCIAAARLLARANRVRPRFVHATATRLPFKDESFDRVVGMSILHHLPESEVAAAALEVHRVLKPHGTAIFWEPTENSRVFALLQNLIPVGGKTAPVHRPSILARRAWREYIAQTQDRALTVRELQDAGECFDGVAITPLGLLVRLERLIGTQWRAPLMTVDRALLRTVPPLRRYCRTVLVEYRKGARTVPPSGIAANE